MKVKDVLIVGGSLSGSMAGYLLGKAGKDVAILEPRWFPRYKACGEGLSVLGQEILDKVGLWSTVLSQNSVPFYGYNLNLKDGNNFELSFRKDQRPEGYGIQRSILDFEVQNSARQYSDIIEESANSIEYKNDKWHVKTASQLFVCKELVLAWGGSPKIKDKIITKNHDSDLKRSRYGLAMWVKGQWHRESNRMINVFQKDGLQILTTPVASDILNLSVLIDKTALLSKEEITEMAMEVSRNIGFYPSEIISTQGASAIHSAVCTNSYKGAYRIGDAIERFDPIGGMGMTNAISSAVLVSKIINYQFEKSLESASANRVYCRAYSGLAWYYRNLTNLSFHTLVNWNPMLVKIAERFPLIRTNVFKLSKYFTQRKIGELC